METTQMIGGWSAGDRAGDAGHAVRPPDTVRDAAWVNAFKRRTYALLEPHDEMRLLDVGCGTGDDVRALAALFWPTGEAVGIGTSAAMVAEARKRATGKALPVCFHIGDVQDLDFPDDTFDGVRAERTLQQVGNPQRAIAEMARVARPGGRIVVAEEDVDTLTIDAADRVTTRAIVHAIGDMRRNGWSIRQAPAYFRQSGLTEIAVVADTWILTDYALASAVLDFAAGAQGAHERGGISAEDAACWFADMETRAVAGAFYCTITAFIVSGRKP
jgi:ubiquinone/menaquinone biosynthesis C-methylase UbiE